MQFLVMLWQDGHVVWSRRQACRCCIVLMAIWQLAVERLVCRLLRTVHGLQQRQGHAVVAAQAQNKASLIRRDQAQRPGSSQEKSCVSRVNHGPGARHDGRRAGMCSRDSCILSCLGAMDGSRFGLRWAGMGCSTQGTQPPKARNRQDSACACMQVMMGVHLDE